MTNLFYVGFNGYGQCPIQKKIILPRKIENWVQCPLERGSIIQCTFTTVIINSGKNFVIYGLTNQTNKNRFITISSPFFPQSFVATDEFLFISKNNAIWKSKFNNEWSEIQFSLEGPEDLMHWNQKNIVNMCFMHHKKKIILLLNDGSVWTLYDNKLSCTFFPLLDKAASISSGFEHTLIQTQSGCVFSFGNGSRGQLGHGDLNSSEKPLQILSLGGLKIVKIATGGWHSCAISDSGDLYMWGWNNFGQMTTIRENISISVNDNLSVSAFPMLVDIKPDEEIGIIDIACGTRHTVAIANDGNLYSTGWNEYGQLGTENLNLKAVNSFIKLNLSEPKNSVLCGPWSTIVYNAV